MGLKKLSKSLFCNSFAHASKNLSFFVIRGTRNRAKVFLIDETGRAF